MKSLEILKINGKNFYCILRDGYTVGRNKLWADDTGRTYGTGAFKGTLIGIFPKLTIEFFPQSTQELKELSIELDKESQTIEYYNLARNSKYTQKFYSNDYELNLSTYIDGKPTWKPFKVSFIAEERE